MSRSITTGLAALSLVLAYSFYLAGCATPSPTVSRCPLNSEQVDEIQMLANSDADAQTQLGILYKKGECVEQNYESARVLFVKAADQGHPKGQHELGKVYFYGVVAPRDYTQAAAWFRRAADQGHPDALFYLGEMYSGRGLDKDMVEAARWYRKAVEKGHVQARGRLYAIEGEEKEQLERVDDLNAILRAAEQGDVNVQYDVAERFRLGQGVEQNHELATNWYQRSAQAGHTQAQFQLAKAYQSGQGVELDPAAAIQWYERAITAGHREAKLALAQLYASGSGVPSDPAKASELLRAWVETFGRIGVVTASVPSQVGLTVPESSGLPAVDFTGRGMALTGIPQVDAALLGLTAASIVLAIATKPLAEMDEKRVRKEHEALGKNLTKMDVRAILEKEVPAVISTNLPNFVRSIDLADGHDGVKRYSSLKDRGIDSVVELTLKKISFAEQFRAPEASQWIFTEETTPQVPSDPCYQLVMDGEAQLIDTAEGAIVKTTSVTYQGAARIIPGWLANDAHAFREALRMGIEDMAPRLVKQLFELQSVSGITRGAQPKGEGELGLPNVQPSSRCEQTPPSAPN